MATFREEQGVVFFRKVRQCALAMVTPHCACLKIKYISEYNSHLLSTDVCHHFTYRGGQK